MPFTRRMLWSQIGVIVALAACGLVAVVLLLRSTLQHEFEQRALAVARTVAADRGLGDLVAAREQPLVAQIAAAQQSATGALFVVVTDDQGIRLAHPNPGQIGRPVSTDPDPALAGQEVATIERGTLGLSARGKVPLRDSTGTIVGEVSVGFTADSITDALWSLNAVAIPAGLLAVAIGAVFSLLLARWLKRATFGLEPAELADLLRERQAVLYAITDGVLAVDHLRRVTMCNGEAQRLLGTPIEAGNQVDDLELPARLAESLRRQGPENVIAVQGDHVLVGRYRKVELDGRDLGGVLTLQDRTDLEQLTSELAAVRSMTSALRAQRHEFANRMHTVMGLLQAGVPDLMAGRATPARAPDPARAAILDAVEYLQSSTQFSAADQVSTTQALQSNTIRAFMAAKIAHAAERGVRLRLSEESWVPQKLVAPVEVVTVLGNLVDNGTDAAAAATVRPAVVEVDLLSDGADLVVSVANSGEGIAADKAEAIFVQGVSTRGPGRGLGLAIARSTARDLGGDLELANLGGDGQETVFVARLPGVLAPVEES